MPESGNDRIDGPADGVAVGSSRVTRDRVERELRETVDAIDVGMPLSIEFANEGFEWIPPSRISEDHRLVAAAVKAWTPVCGEHPTCGVFPGGTDARLLEEVGLPTLPGVGPGCLIRAHAADEFVTLEELSRAYRLYVGIADEYALAG